MTLIDLKKYVPDATNIVGHLLDNYENNLDELDQDIVLIELPSGHHISVSWTPEYERVGRFLVELVLDDWNSPIRTAFASDTRGVLDIISKFARFGKCLND